uniref:CD27 antigen n=1 Tax=Vombatus ursinus TaxID=29139 RepID=A0A4X2LJB6_VOMUR
MVLGTSWWLWVLGTLVGLSPGVISKLHCPQGQYQVEQGSWCCRLCNPGTFLVGDCDGDGKEAHCKSCIPGFSFTPDHHAQRQCESCRICINETAGTSAPTRPAQSPSGTVPSSQVSIYILLILCGLILTIFIHGTWLILKKRNRQLKKEQDKKKLVKFCLTGSREDPGPCCPKQEEGNTVPIQEDYRKPDPASYP